MIYPQVAIDKCLIIPVELRGKISTVWKAPEIYFPQALKVRGGKHNVFISRCFIIGELFRGRIYSIALIIFGCLDWKKELYILYINMIRANL